MSLQRSKTQQTSLHLHGRLPIIFCDFDGTITESDNIVAIMKHFDPPGWQAIVDTILAQQMTVREGVGRLFSLLPSSKKDDIARFAIANAKIRPGFRELLNFCKERSIPFLVTSGGIDFFVYPLLSPFPLDRSQIYCNHSDFSGDSIRIVWEHACDDQCDNDCGMCKTKIIRSYDRKTYFRILIGDSVTDFAGARLADLVFARSHLLTRCRDLGVPYYAYETFYDVIDQLSKEVEYEQHS